uniref:Uncharacterized protein n=1 Tax=Lactuca sativa TaxID=4236 RepID=A0A9R1WSD6_LACSA|nr:hypothetical protein LSAT_V11C100000690 [Lactuca sativa]
MVLTKGLVVDVATNHGRAHYPVGSWLGIVVVDNEERKDVSHIIVVVNQDHKATHELLVCYYFADNVFIMIRHSNVIFVRIRHYFYILVMLLRCVMIFFKQKSDPRGRIGFTSLQKCLATLRYLGYNIAFDASDEYLKDRNRVCNFFFAHVCMNEVYHEEYLCKP